MSSFFSQSKSLLASILSFGNDRCGKRPIPVASYLLLLAALISHPALSIAATPSDALSPKLTLQGADGENHCTLEFKTQNYVFKGNKNCKNDKAIGVELEHAPSASNILLFDDYTCDRRDSGNYFWVYLRTIKEDVTTAIPIDLEIIAAAPKGSVVAPGVRLIDRYQKPGESMKKRTSCVRIEVDAPVLPEGGN